MAVLACLFPLAWFCCACSLSFSCPFLSSLSFSLVYLQGPEKERLAVRGQLSAGESQEGGVSDLLKVRKSIIFTFVHESNFGCPVAKIQTFN